MPPPSVRSPLRAAGSVPRCPELGVSPPPSAGTPVLSRSRSPKWALRETAESDTVPRWCKMPSPRGSSIAEFLSAAISAPPVSSRQPSFWISPTRRHGLVCATALHRCASSKWPRFSSMFLLAATVEPSASFRGSSTSWCARGTTSPCWRHEAPARPLGSLRARRMRCETSTTASMVCRGTWPCSNVWRGSLQSTTSFTSTSSMSICCSLDGSGFPRSPPSTEGWISQVLPSFIVSSAMLRSSRSLARSARRSLSHAGWVPSITGCRGKALGSAREMAVTLFFWVAFLGRRGRIEPSRSPNEPGCA